MKNEIIDEIHSISTNEGGIYSALFGYEEFNVIKDITVSIAAKIENEDDLKNMVHIFLDLIIAKLFEAMKFDYEDDEEPGIYYNQNWSKKYANAFLPGTVSLDAISICDLENRLSDIQVSKYGDYTTINLNLPVYAI